MRKALFCLFAFCLLAPALFAQVPRFEVASIRPGRPGAPGGVTTGKGRLLVENETLKRCIMGAFSVGPNQIVGGPSWLETDTFVITAKAEEPVDDDAVIMAMLRTLLKERFKLEAHRESRTIRAYVIEVAKNEPRLQKSAGGESSTLYGRGRISAKATTMDHFGEVLSRVMDFPVVNQTGIEGIFDLKIEWTNADTGPSIFTAMQEQLGLRLASRKTPVDMVVIDHVEKPTEN
ncbi:MAG TPA: TIGR03435 family protein [Bryobacteraceae bacterium]|nr:TIGR03435 family protein [Bryobacteraceae bacterium]